MEDNATQLKFEVSDNAKYKMEAIRDSAVYARELESKYLLGLYYLILWKSYPKEENI